MNTHKILNLVLLGLLLTGCEADLATKSRVDNLERRVDQLEASNSHLAHASEVNSKAISRLAEDVGHVDASTMDNSRSIGMLSDGVRIWGLSTTKAILKLDDRMDAVERR